MRIEEITTGDGEVEFTIRLEGSENTYPLRILRWALQQKLKAEFSVMTNENTFDVEIYTPKLLTRDHVIEKCIFKAKPELRGRKISIKIPSEFVKMPIVI